MTLRLITASLLVVLAVVPTAAAGSRPTRPVAAPPDAFERAVARAESSSPDAFERAVARAESSSPDAFMRYVGSHPNGTIADHPDAFAGVAASVPRTGISATNVEDGSWPSLPVTVLLAGIAVLGLAVLLRQRLSRRLRMRGAAAR
jgi:hypothetical protein